MGVVEPGQGGTDLGTTARLKAQMQADALRPLSTSSVGGEEGDDERPLRMGTCVDSDGQDHDEAIAVWPEETLLQVGGYLRLSVSRILRFTSSAIGLVTIVVHARVSCQHPLLDDRW